MNATPASVKDGDHCTVVAGTHKGKSGVVEDSNTSKTGHVTITVRQANGDRFKTLARSVVRQARQACR
jgi:ribosomal protein S4E